MPYTFHIDEQQRTVFFRADGALSDQDFMRCITEVVEHPSFQPGFKHLVDLTRCTHMAPSAEQMRRRINQDRALQARLGNAQCALITDDFFIYAVTRIYKILMRDGPLKVELFRNEAQARLWLGLDKAC